ncbi:hypothetical protein ACFXPY_33015 [Streptomyces sp. NPDC059153]|uniref:hypothetical protein n=1 Tax=Streptomyces sp. NPDC059153 TaxID=3346743 RepID=UPI00369AE88B
MRAAVERRGVAVVVVPGEIFPGRTDRDLAPAVVRPARALVRPDDGALREAAALLNDARRVTILAGAGGAGAHDDLVRLAETLKAPVVHALRGKEYVEYDNPYDVGPTGLLGFASGYKAIEEADTLLMLGTDFPYRQFYPRDAPPARNCPCPRRSRWSRPRASPSTPSAPSSPAGAGNSSTWSPPTWPAGSCVDT